MLNISHLIMDMHMKGKHDMETLQNIDNVQLLDDDEFEITYDNGDVEIHKGDIHRIYILPKQTAPGTFLIDFELIP